MAAGMSALNSWRAWQNLQALISTALASGLLSPAWVGAVAVHGTGTPLGDPIEVGAIKSAFMERSAGLPLSLTSVKSCYGHTEGTAGAAAVQPAKRILYALLLVFDGLPFPLHLILQLAGVTGLLLALAASARSQAPAIMCLQNMNPYVVAALSTTASSRGRGAAVPRQLAPGPCVEDARFSGGCDAMLESPL